MSAGSFKRFLREPVSEWGILGGIGVAFLAVVAPPYLLAPLFAHIVSQLALSRNTAVSLMQMIFNIVAFGIILFALKAYGRRLKDIGFSRVRWEHFLKAAGGFVLYAGLSLLLMDILHSLLHFNQNQPQELGYVAPQQLEIVFAFLAIVIITPVAEETIFRGFLFKGLRHNLPFWVAAIATSVLFGVAHGQWNVGLDVFAMSMVSCYLVEHTKSLWPSIFLHALKNSVAFYLLYLYNGG